MEEKEEDMHKMHDGKNVSYYTCPMHPEVKSNKLGICPKCGMNLVPAKADIKEFEKHKGHSPEMFFRKFLVSLALTIPVVLYSPLVKKIIQLPEFPGSQYLSLTLGSIVFFYGGLIFIQGAFMELKARLPGMMTLIALAIIAAYLYSIFAVFSGTGETLFWELTTLITVMLFGHWMEMKSFQSSQKALKELAKLLPDTAEIIINGKTKTVPINELRVNDIVLIRPGSKIPADGIVVEGDSDVNEAMITGESRPVKKIKNNEVIAGTINGDGSLRVKVTKIGEKTFLAGVMRLVSEAQASKSRIQVLSDKAASLLTYIAIITGSLTFGAWIILQKDAAFALGRLVTVLVIACPHALGLAIPLVSTISTTLAAKTGLLIKQRLSLESARKIDIVMFDKTGTLTKGEYGVDSIIAEDKNEALKIAAAVDAKSEHFVAKAIVNEAKKRNLKLSEVKNFKRIPGKGVEGRLGNKKVVIGGEAVLGKIKIQGQLQKDIEILSKQGKTIIYVIADGGLEGIIALGDIIREESREAVQELKKLGIKTSMITGDSEDVAEWVARELDIDEWFAKVLPNEKSEKVKLLQSRGLKVAMVGDGINDAPALTQADVGIAIGAGTNIAIESAGIILFKNDPRDIVKIIKLSRETYKKMMQNIFWATGYNIIAIPLGAGVLYYQGILLQPALAALFMSLSTVIVAVNAAFLRRLKLDAKV